MDANSLDQSLKSRLPTFSSAILPGERPQKILISVFLISLLITFLALSAGLLVWGRGETFIPKIVTFSRITSKATAYGSQRHIFGVPPKVSSQSQLPSTLAGQPRGEVAGVQKILNGSLVVIWLKESQIVASFSNDGGETWQELPSPLVSEKAEVVTAEQDREANLHLVYESEGRIYYRKVTDLTVDGRVKAEGWAVSSLVPLDDSGLAHRPSIILDSASGLPLVAWSSESIRAGAHLTRINFLRAKAEPTSLINWCNAEGTDCGKPAYIIVSGSADSLGIIASHGVFHSILSQMPGSGDIYLWWSETGTRGKEPVLKLAVAKKEGGNWIWGEAREEDKLDVKTYKKFSLAAVADPVNNQILIAYAQAGGNTRVVAYKSDGTTEDLSPGEDLGGQFSLATWEGKYYLFYRREDGLVAGRQYGSWSGELFKSPEEGGYPSVTANPVEGKLYIVYTTIQGNINFLVYSLVKPTATSTPEPTPTEGVIPTEEPGPTEESTPAGEVIPTPTEAAPEEEPTPTGELTPVLTPTPTP